MPFFCQKNPSQSLSGKPAANMIVWKVTLFRMWCAIDWPTFILNKKNDNKLKQLPTIHQNEK